MIGKEILGYQLQEEIGRGTFATVYKVSKTNVLGTYVRALKVISLPTEKQYTDVLHSMGGNYSKANDYFLSILEEVANEINIMDTLTERGVEQIVKYFEHDVVERGEESKFYDIYILMEYLTPFTVYLDDHQLVVADVIRLGKDILRALSRCHELNMIHRDVKDSNIFVSEDGTFKLGDFGVSKILGDSTSAATLKGTPTYIAPEVYLAGQKYDETVDLYSLGIVLYRLLNYFRQPFLPDFPQSYSGRDEFLALEKRLSGQVPKPPSQAPQALGEVILKAISPRSTRFNSAQEFLVALEKVEASLGYAELGRELSSSDPEGSHDEQVIDEELERPVFDETVSLETDLTLVSPSVTWLAPKNQPAIQSSFAKLFETIPLEGQGNSGQFSAREPQAIGPILPLPGRVERDKGTVQVPIVAVSQPKPEPRKNLAKSSRQNEEPYSIQLFETIPPDNRGRTREGQVTPSVSESVVPVFPLQVKVTGAQANLDTETSRSVATLASQPSSTPKVDQPVQSKKPSDQATDQAKTDATKVKSVSPEKTLPEKQTVPTTQLPASSPVKPAGSQPGASLGGQMAPAQLRERLDGKTYLALGLYASLFLTFFIPSSTTWSATSLFLIGFVCLAVLIYEWRRAKQFKPELSRLIKVLMTTLSISLLLGAWHKMDYRYANGDRYRGQLLEGLPHGQGQLVTTSGITFEGEFVKGALKGAAKAIHPNGDIYEGEVQDNKANGKGKLTSSNGDVYEGDFKYNRFNGKGKLTNADGTVYEGDFVDNSYHGKGKLTSSNGDVYEGDFKYDRFNGKGKLTNADGTVYEGDFVGNSYHGKGKLTFSNGDVYEGDFVDGKRTGKGKMTYFTGNVYEGDFANDLYHGKGKHTFSNGDYKEGDFKSGSFSGTGRVKETLDGGGVYEGEVRQHKWHGKGKMTYSNGDVYEGDFVDGKRTGKGKYTWPNGHVYEGDFVDGKRTGKGKYTWPNGHVYEGDFVDGVQHGRGRSTFNSGGVYEGDYVNGRAHGRGRYIYSNGTVFEGDFVYDPATKQVNGTDTTGRVHERIMYDE